MDDLGVPLFLETPILLHLVSVELFVLWGLAHHSPIRTCVVPGGKAPATAAEATAANAAALSSSVATAWHPKITWSSPQLSA